MVIHMSLSFTQGALARSLGSAWYVVIVAAAYELSSTQTWRPDGTDVAGAVIIDRTFGSSAMVTLFWEDLLAAPLTGRRLRFCCREGRAGAPPPPPHRFPEVKGTEDADSCESGARFGVSFARLSTGL
ncbi:hypothetical protein PC112_g22134 [Phytophthora cactorum]|uniref:Uncharacterized protein n=1 Tax=Phytophthora cactorum TaxID=29920 RepID=A0A8T1ALS1_9STRA|nr:hypothetical protein PC112_g22134 [Phytophthora cactorum]KAG2882453.1 hypothetical protein PC117_g26219 [Phytophthora cactorum]KAG3053750.1 hypothetical protein PC122_g22237 [Phytophthora cactorum]